ncbi:MAG: FHA domain-containing protein [Chloroflexota bacterium]|nr:FHA domain-containing protein [Chloroflexota bacterium]
MAIYCPNCGVELPDGVAFCDACGTPLRGQNQGQGLAAPAAQAPAQVAGIGSTACPVCGAAALPGEAFCDNCGASLLAPAAYTPSPAQQSAPAQPQPQPQYAPPLPSYSNAPANGPSAGGYAPGRQAVAALIVTSPPPPATIPVPARPELIVGRSDPQSNSYPDVDLNPYGGLELGVSRRHFRLKREGDQVYVEDLGSMNGVVVNGQKLPPYTLHPLRAGDRILLGKMEMRFDLS